MPDLHTLTATQAARLIQAGTLNPIDLTESCLARIADREPQVRAFHHLDPDQARKSGPTANPAGLGHTPGGSSSGSAAGVAGGFFPIAYGTQTAGSIIRPAAYCGVVGYKPTYNTIERMGMKVMSASLDTVGVMARSVADCALFASAVMALFDHLY